MENLARRPGANKTDEEAGDGGVQQLEDGGVRSGNVTRHQGGRDQVMGGGRQGHSEAEAHDQLRGQDLRPLEL